MQKVIWVFVAFVLSVLFILLIEQGATAMATEKATVVSASGGNMPLAAESWYQGTFADLSAAGVIGDSPLANATAGTVTSTGATGVLPATASSGAYLTQRTEYSTLMSIIGFIPLLILLGMTIAAIYGLFQFSGMMDDMVNRIINAGLTMVVGFLMGGLLLTFVDELTERFAVAPFYTGVDLAVEIVVTIYVLGLLAAAINTVMPGGLMSRARGAMGY